MAATMIVSRLTRKYLLVDDDKEKDDFNLKELYCSNCQKSFGLYNEKYFSDKSLEKMKMQHCSLHIFYGHVVIIRDSAESCIN